MPDTMTPGAKQVCKATLSSLGLPTDDKFVEHLGVLLEAVSVHMDRDATYGDHWVENGGMDNMRNALRKVKRQIAVLSTVTDGGEMPTLHKDFLDDAFDALNYLTFAIRNVRRLNIDGTDAD